MKPIILTGANCWHIRLLNWITGMHWQQEKVMHSKNVAEPFRSILNAFAPHIPETPMPNRIDKEQMQRDFDAMPEPIDGPMRRARKLVEDHIADFGMVPHPDKLKDAIAEELALAQLRAPR